LSLVRVESILSPHASLFDDDLRVHSDEPDLGRDA
jgi:hypothetical protein